MPITKHAAFIDTSIEHVVGDCAAKNDDGTACGLTLHAHLMDMDLNPGKGRCGRHGYQPASRHVLEAYVNQ